MKWWKPLLILLLCATPSWAGFWSDFPGVGPGTVLNDVIIDNSTINSSTLNQPIINSPTFNGTSTYNPGTIINYDSSTIINGPNGSYWTNEGIDDLASLTIAVGGTLTIPTGSFLYLPDGSVWDSKGLSTLNIQAGGVITIGGIPAGGACPANQFYIALSSALVPTCAPVTNIPGPVTIHNPTFTGTVTGPDGGTWTSTGISLPSTSNITVGTVNITGTGGLTFNAVAVGGTCPANEYVYSISPTLVPVCSTPTGGGGGGTIATPVSVANGGLGQGNAPSVGQILVANGPSQYNPVTMSGDATINSAGAVTVVSAGGKPIQPLTSTSVTAPTNPVVGQLYFDPTKLQTYIWYNDGTSSQWVAVVNLSAATLNNPTLNNPTFTGTLQFPDGSYYDTNGHEVMKNLGVGVVAQNLTSNNSITVQGGWTFDISSPAVNAYWDKYGMEQLYDVNSEYVDTGDPSLSVDGWATIHGDVSNAALGNPWAESDLTNQSAYVSGAEDTGYNQRWQGEGFQDLNAIGIHQQTWQQGCTGTNVTSGITGAGASLSDCAVAAIASSFNNNLNYKILLQNASTGTAAQASFLLTSSASTGGMYLTGTGFTPTGVFVYPDQLVITTNATHGIAIPNTVGRVTALGIGVPAATTAGNLITAAYNGNGAAAIGLSNNSAGVNANAGLYLNNNGTSSSWIVMTGTNFTGQGPNVPGDILEIATNGVNGMLLTTNATLTPGPPIVFWAGPAKVVTMTELNGAGTMVIPSTNQSTIMWGSGTQPAASLMGYGNNSLYLSGGTHWTGSAWIADGTVATSIISGGAGLSYYVNAGLTPGAAYNPTVIYGCNANGCGHTHQGNLPNSYNGGVPVPSLTGGTLSAGSTDQFGIAMANAGVSTMHLTFGTPYPGGGNVVCMLVNYGNTGVWFESGTGNTGTDLNCITPNTGAACTQQWVAYFCANTQL